MRSTWLLLVACRRDLLRGVLVEAGIGGFVLYASWSLLPAGPEGGSLGSIESAQFFLGAKAQYFMVCIALVSALLGGIHHRLRGLCVPVTSRQLAYIPLLAVFLHYGLAVAAVQFVTLAEMSQLVALEHWLYIVNTLRPALPWVILGLVAGAWAIFHPTLATVFFIVPYFPVWLPILSSFRSGEALQSLVPDVSSWWLILVLLSLFYAWYAPRFFDTLRLGTTTLRIPGFAHHKLVPEWSAPRRLHLGVELGLLPWRMIAWAVWLLMLVVVPVLLLDTLWNDASMGSDAEITRTSFWIELSLQIGVAGFVAIIGAYYLLQAVFHAGQAGQFNTRARWFQPILWLFSSLKHGRYAARIGSRRLVVYNPDIRRYQLAHECDAHVVRQAAGKHVARTKDPWSLVGMSPFVFLHVIALSLFFVIGYQLNPPGFHAASKRCGSGVLGDSLAMPEPSGARSSLLPEARLLQHYVALEPTGLVSPRERERWTERVRAVLGELPPVRDWVDAYQGLDGLPVAVPEHYRIELAPQEDGRLVVQAIGLRWDPPGALALGLAEQIRSMFSQEVLVGFNDEYRYYRHGNPFRPSWGFLDNEIHWVELADDRDQYPPPLPGDTPVYVNVANTSAHQDGKSWGTAFTSLQNGIDSAYRRRVAGVWVAAGVYDEARDYEGSVKMRLGVHLYGGFTGTETSRSERDWEANPTIIDGSTARDGAAAYHVVLGANSATLDGFVVRGGNANGDEEGNNDGGGMLNYRVSPTVANCVFTNNATPDFGGAVFNYKSSPRFSHCTFVGNMAGETGGAMCNFSECATEITYCDFMDNVARSGGALDSYESEPWVTDCRFTNNRAQNSGGAVDTGKGRHFLSDCIFEDNVASGGGAVSFRGDSKAVNCVFERNQADLGPAVKASDCEPTLVNCTVVGNQSGDSDWDYACLGTPILVNCIVWGNDCLAVDPDATVRFSNIEGGFAGEGTMRVGPRFVDPARGDWRLRSDSPCIDVGTEQDAPARDLDGTLRPQGAGIDMGAYEHVPGVDYSTVETVADAVDGADGGRMLRVALGPFADLRNLSVGGSSTSIVGVGRYLVCARGEEHAEGI